jgi:site-specific DNA-cytosine methylase
MMAAANATTFGVLHLFCGAGGAALGFQEAASDYRGVRGQFATLGGVDVDPESCADFEALTGVPATRLDLFSRSDYAAFHGHEPPADWREATARDVRAASGGLAPDVVFLSPPCKGFSALLPRARSESEKYQALNRLVIRGLRLTIEAFRDDLPPIILLENVPRITTRGAALLTEVKSVLGSAGYIFAEGSHDCGEIGGLAQHRRRYLLIARLPAKVPALVYQPPKLRVRAIGEVIGPLPLPDDPSLGRLHRLPRLKWRTWVRLALIPAGGDWRDLERTAWSGRYRIIPWDGPCGTVTSGDGPSCHAPAVSDPRWFDGAYKVGPWDQPSATITSGHAPSCGRANVADPRLGNRRHNQLRVEDWDGPVHTVTTGCHVSGGAPSVADPRWFKNKQRVEDWGRPAHTVTGIPDIQAGAPSVADPRIPFNNVYRVTGWSEPAGAVTAGAGPSSSGVCVGDPRLGCRPLSGAYGVIPWDEPAPAVTGAGDVHTQGAAAVADPRIPADDAQPDPPPVIMALDGTWHRPLTTLELAVLQGFPTHMRDGRPLALAGKADSRWRERIGNAVPVGAARAMAEQVLQALLPAMFGEWVLGITPIWVAPGRRGYIETLPAPLAREEEAS